LFISWTKMADPSDPPAAFNFENDIAHRRIWKVEENTILQSHIEGYRSAPKNNKAKYVAKKVLPAIKACWNGRYDKKKFKNDEALRKEWEKKKVVRVLRVINILSFIDQRKP